MAWKTCGNVRFGWFQVNVSDGTCIQQEMSTLYTLAAQEISELRTHSQDHSRLDGECSQSSPCFSMTATWTHKIQPDLFEARTSSRNSSLSVALAFQEWRRRKQTIEKQNHPDARGKRMERLITEMEACFLVDSTLPGKNLKDLHVLSVLRKWIQDC